MPVTVSVSPGRRAWQRFRRNRLGFWSLWVFGVLVVLSLFAEILSTDKPLIVRYEGRTYDTGSKLGFLTANLAYALERKDLGGPLRTEIARLLAED